MDVKQYMIVDLEKRGDKRMFMTGQIVYLNKAPNGLWMVKFDSSQRIFNYNPSRLLCLTNPISIDIKEKGLYINNKHITNIKELLCFSDDTHTFYHVTYTNGYYEDLEGKNVYVTRTRIDKNGGSTWEYLNKLAAETGLTTDENENILTKQYELVDIQRDNVPLAQFLGDKTPLKTYQIPNLVYYPFGCNASQKVSVENALTHQVSIIQGPPGTGKTQTILNIIANLIINNKTVLVVSNNNSAVENIEEKLASVDLDFIVAKLGSVKNKENFIDNQPEYPLMDNWVLEERDNVKQTAKDSLHNVSIGFEAQINKAQLKTELDALLVEAKYNKMLESKIDGHKWLYNKKPYTLLKLLNQFKSLIEREKEPSILFRLKWAFLVGFKIFSLTKEKPIDVISKIEAAYYAARELEIKADLEATDSILQNNNISQNIDSLRLSSLHLLKDTIAKRFNKGDRKHFEIREIKSKTSEFLKEYPIVLSTTYSAKSCIDKDMVFDYVIMDEASQVDIKTGALALSCATNIVIVGDDKQLPNVVSTEEERALSAIQSTYKVEDKYNAVTHSFLKSCIEVFKDAPTTLLREHYRCHPKIIEFCNKRFYDNELITMTSDNGEENVLQLIRTVKGNHERQHYNQREIDVIKEEVLPEYKESESLGIITPYKVQSAEINKTLEQEIASTVHKYQGRECDTIIMSLVDNEPTEFSDDANLINVAISRAKKHLCVVTNGNDIDQNSNIAQLIAYIQYNNFVVRESKIHSVFDLLYKQYTEERLAYEAKHHKVSEHLSENLIYTLLEKIIYQKRTQNLSILCHYPVMKLIADWESLDKTEMEFAKNPLSHVDFLIYNTITKKPQMAIEVDGWKYHVQSEVQQARDVIKNTIFSKIGLPLKRLSTTETVNEENLSNVLFND